MISQAAGKVVVSDEADLTILEDGQVRVIIQVEDRHEVIEIEPWRLSEWVKERCEDHHYEADDLNNSAICDVLQAQIRSDLDYEGITE